MDGGWSSVTGEAISADDSAALRSLILGVVDDPRMVLVKLADRLHNMRTLHVLEPVKASAVANETLAVWCSLAARLGAWAIKAELEDLCFAVLLPETFWRLKRTLDLAWVSGGVRWLPGIGCLQGLRPIRPLPRSRAGALRLAFRPLTLPAPDSSAAEAVRGRV